MPRLFFIFYFVFCILLSTCSIYAQGRLIIPGQLPGFKTGDVYLKDVLAEVELREGVGEVRLEQQFYNNSGRQMEGEYIFALPGESQIRNFFLYMNGKKVQGQVHDALEARRIYEDIVRNMRDPALLECSGYGLFKARMFPIEPQKTGKIEVSYAQVLPVESDLYRFTLPIRQSGQGHIDSYRLTVRIRSGKPLNTIYSPSHQIRIERQGEKEAIVSLESSNLEGDRDFILYYSENRHEIDASALSFRPRTDRDGYFMLLVSPSFQTDHKVLPKDVIFVIDVSGSMAGEKIIQARDALNYCLSTLNPEDRFEMISFSSGVNAFQNRLNEVNRTAMENAAYFIDNLSAVGGTNIDAALAKALDLKRGDDGRPTSIVFLTDGLPTEGETDIGAIVRNVKAKKRDFIRIFSFGVGFDVNTFLLDKLGNDSGGSSNYVKPGENIEREVSGFFAKITSPVLTSPVLNMGGLAVYDVYPVELPDLFRGQRAMVLGRYRRADGAQITLSGKQEDKTRHFNYEITLPERERENDFIANLWANRKISHLLMQIRMQGENEELVSSIKTLAAEYGIVTPYTSYLVTEQQKEMADLASGTGAGGASMLRLSARKEARLLGAAADEETVGSESFNFLMGAAPAPAEKSTGRGAVMASRALKKYAGMEQDKQMLLTVRRIDEKTFTLTEGIWVENDLKKETKEDRNIRFLSDEYFRLLNDEPGLKQILAMGEQLLFRWDKVIYRIIQD